MHKGDVVTMVKLPEKRNDPTLEAMNAALAAKQDKYRRPYLGMSAIGMECEHRLWLSFRWTTQPDFDADTLKRFEDGHASEDIMAARLRQTPGITLITLDPATGRQFGYQDFGGHFRGHEDGHIEGLLQAPVTPHLWEHKCTNETKFKKLDKLAALNEKTALQQWDQTYYAQHVLYMDYGGYTRGYLTCSTPGTREETSVRTNADPVHAAKLKAKAERIIFSEDGRPKVSDDDTFYLCRFCDAADVCRKRRAPDRNCRTCAHVTPKPDGTWHCSRHETTLDRKAQEVGCGSYLVHPTFVPGTPVDAGTDWIEYKMDDGSVWRDSAEENS